MAQKGGILRTQDDLTRSLQRIDGRGYRAYKDIRGAYSLTWPSRSKPRLRIELHIDHVQSDPFASPSRLRIRVPADSASIPKDWFSNPIRRMALEDALAREMHDALHRTDTHDGQHGSGKSGLISIDAGGQEVLQRTAVTVTADHVEARLRVGLPAAGRTVLGRQAEKILLQRLPQAAHMALFYESLDSQKIQSFVDCVENQEYLRTQLPEHRLVAFVADGAILPRASGVSQKPMSRAQAVPFSSPPTFRVSLPLKHPLSDGRQSLEGMGVPEGVTLIVGGGYHGKSTVLQALERGVYPHIPGDGREWVISLPLMMKIRSEDGRRVEQVDISAFINDLPRGGDTRRFSTDDASGSTSQAANIVEAMEAGAQVLLLDEDTSATNFMVRDARMQALVQKHSEPITPYIDRVRELHRQLGISTVLVMGGCGDYFDVADHVIMMREFAPEDATRAAREVAERHPTHRSSEALNPIASVKARAPQPFSFDASRGRKEVKIDVRSTHHIGFGRHNIDLSQVAQLMDSSQTRAVGHAIFLCVRQLMDGSRTLAEVLTALDRQLDEQGLDILDPFYRPGQHPGEFARPRRLEIAAAINRLRTLAIKQNS